MTKLLACLLLLSGLSFGQALNTLKGVPLGGAGSSVPSACTGQGTMFFKTAATRGWYWCNGGSYTAFGTGSGSGTVTSIGTTSPITGGTITTTGTVACATCTTAAAALTSGQVLTGSGLQAMAASGTALSALALLASPTFTGTPLTTTAAVDTNTTQIASTAYVVAQAASATPLIDGSAAVGTSTRYARGDHVHPTDSTRAPLASPTFTGTATAPLIATTTNCAAAGTAANPSVASCSAAPAGAFSCATNSSAGTCTVNTTAVTANSRIFVQESAAEGSNLSVTCNTAPTVVPAVLLASKSAATSFTINSPTFTVNPVCFVYWIVN